MWNCGDTYEYPIPKPNGDSWEVILHALLKKDKAQCDAWKDEVQNLLIFVSGQQSNNKKHTLTCS